MAHVGGQKSEQRGKSTYGWVVIISWMTVHMWGFVVMESLGILLPSIRAELGLTRVQEGWLGSAPQLTALFLAIPAGWYMSRFSPKLLTLVSIAGGAGIIFFQAWAPVYAVLLLGRLLYGVSIVIREPARALLLRMWIKPREILIANASIELLWAFGAAFFILVPIILEALDDDWRKALMVFGFISIGMSGVWLVMGRERPIPATEGEKDELESVSLRWTLRHKELWLVAIGVVGVEMTFSAFITFWPSLMLDRYGISLRSSALIWAIGGIAAGPMGLGINLVLNRIGKRRTWLRLCGILISASTVALLYSDSFSALIVISIVHGVSFSVFPVIFTIPFQLSGIRPREIAVAMGFLRSAMMLGAVTGPLLAGSLSEVSGDLRLALTIVSFSALTLTGGALLLSGEWDRGPQEQSAATA